MTVRHGNYNQRTEYVIKAFLTLVGLFVFATASAHALSKDSASILVLLKSTSALEVDQSDLMPAPGISPDPSWDPKTHPFVDVKDLRPNKGFPVIGGAPLADSASIGRLSNGTQVLAVPLWSGGSGQVFTQVLFAQNDHGNPFYLGYITSGGFLEIHITNHGIVAEFPTDGPNGCPTKVETDVYTIVGHHLKLLTERNGAPPSSYKPC